MLHALKKRLTSFEVISIAESLSFFSWDQKLLRIIHNLSNKLNPFGNNIHHNLTKSNAALLCHNFMKLITIITKLTTIMASKNLLKSMFFQKRKRLLEKRMKSNACKQACHNSNFWIGVRYALQDRCCCNWLVASLLACLVTKFSQKRL